MPDLNPPSLPEWAVRALRAPVDSQPASRERVMHAVRALHTPRRMSAPASAMRSSRWFRRGSLSGAGGVLLTAAFAFMISMHRGEQLAVMQRLQASAVVLGDTVVPVIGAADSVGARLLDTLRIVQFAISGAHVGSAEVIGTFNGWRRGSTMLVRVGTDDEWRARVLVPRDALDFAYVISDLTTTPLRERRLPAAPLPAHN